MSYTPALYNYAQLSLGHFRWAKDDSFISIAAMPEITNPDGTYASDPNGLHQIYAAGVAFDANTGLPALTTSSVVVAVREQPGFDDIKNHDWSPDGKQRRQSALWP